ncbi:hypothetical protein ACHAXS_013536 [Conticribra weissflogii]
MKFARKSPGLPEDYDYEIIHLWTSKFLEGFDRPNTSKEKRNLCKTEIVFGKTMSVQQKDVSSSFRPKTAPIPPISKRLTLTTKLADSRATQVQQHKLRLTQPVKGQESKLRGRQIRSSTPVDISEALEKRTRQLQYSREIASGKSSKGRQIDSITRIVVQSFRNLIKCERCALFLMDESTNELYFKPIGDPNHSARVKEIRFPATSGVAGWVASNKLLLNIKNAYHDKRFNPEIDRATGFRTRTILCAPVMSSSNSLLGVIQMVNKLKGDAKELRDAAKKKKSDKTNKGYDSCFEPFSEQDEDTLEKCCAQVSRAVEEVLSNNAIKTEKQPGIQIDFGDNNTNQIARDRLKAEEPFDSTKEENPSICESQTRPHASSFSTGRRSSVGALAQFVKRHSISNVESDGAVSFSEIDAFNDNRGFAEALQQFKLRETPTLIPFLEMERRQRKPEYKAAQSKRTRMVQYNEARRSGFMKSLDI